MIALPEVSWLAIAPEIFLAFGAAGVLLSDVQWKPQPRILGGIAGGSVLLAGVATVFQWVEVGDALAAGAPAELVVFSGMVLMDGFAIFGRMALLAVTALGVAGGWPFFSRLGRRTAEALALVLLATAGFSIMVASNHLVMLFLGLEIGSISLYVLAGFTLESRRSNEAAIKYFLLGSFASALFIYGVALVYAGTGQLEVLALRFFLGANLVTSPAVILMGVALMIVGLGFKISAAPFHSWAPDVYQGAPAGVVGYMAATAKIAGFIALARILLRGLLEFDASWLPVLAAISAISMLAGSILALVQGDVRRMLAYSGVAHAGFIMTGVVGGSTSSILFYVGVYAIQLVGSFAIVTATSGPTGTASDLAHYRGLASTSPGLAAAFSVLLLGMAGLPVTSGFVAKFGVFASAWASGFEWLVIVAVLASVIAFAFYLRIIVVMYMEESQRDRVVVSAPVRVVLALTVAVTILWGILPASLRDLAADALAL